MRTSEGLINRDSRSYARGVVLGLTMAEALLLLVFCLLIGVAAALAAQEDSHLRTVERLTAESARLTQALKERERQVQELSTSDLLPDGRAELIERSLEIADRLDAAMRTMSITSIDEFWREVVQNDSVVAEFEQRGVSAAQLIEGADFLSKVEVLRPEGAVAEEVVAGYQFAAEIAAATQQPISTKEDAQRAASSLLRDIAVLQGFSNREDGGPGAFDRPPMIRLSEADGYFFRSGSAELTDAYRNQILGNVIPSLVENAAKYGVDVIEVVGHTDQQPLGSRPSNLDSRLVDAVQNRSPVSALSPGDNAGLGLARAVSVASFLLADPRLSAMKIHPLSAAQLIDTDETLTSLQTGAMSDQRRRIEIRLRRSEAALAGAATQIRAD